MVECRASLTTAACAPRRALRIIDVFPRIEIEALRIIDVSPKIEIEASARLPTPSLLWAAATARIVERSRALGERRKSQKTNSSRAS